MSGYTLRDFAHVSPSQIESFSLCRRKWWFRSIAGIEEPEKPSAALGTAIHAALEDYVENGTMPDTSTPAGRAAEPGLVFLTPRMAHPTEGWALKERAIDPEDEDTLRLSGVPLKMRIDLVDPSQSPIEIIDHKSTSDLKWAKSEDELPYNVQMVIYAKWAMTQCQVPVVGVSHIVYVTAGRPYSKKTGPVHLDAAHVDSEWEKLGLVVDQMKDTATARLPSDVPPSHAACGAFGGCYFRSRCALIDNNTLSDLDELFETPSPQELMPVSNATALSLARLQATKNGTTAAAKPAATPKPTTPAPAAKPAASSSAQLNALRAKTAGSAPAATTAPATTKPAATPTANPLLSKLRGSAPATTTAPAPATAAAAAKPNPLLSKMKPPSAEAATTTTPAPSTAKPASTKPPLPVPPKSSTSLADRLKGGASGVLPPDAPTGSTDAALNDAIQSAATTAQAAKRRPKNYKASLSGLGWETADIEKMNPDAMHQIIDGNIVQTGNHTVDDNGNVNLGEVEDPVDILVQSLRAFVCVPEYIGQALSYDAVLTAWSEHDGLGDTISSNIELWTQILSAGNHKGYWDFSVSEIFPFAAGLPDAEPAPTPGEAENEIVSDADASVDTNTATPALISSEDPEIDNIPVSTDGGKTWSGVVTITRPGLPPKVAPAPGQEGLVLFVNCHPQKGHWAKNSTMLDDIVAPFAHKVAETRGAPHYTLLPFQEGPKMVAMLIGSQIPRIIAGWPTIIIDTRNSACASAVLEVLLPHASVVIRS